MKNKKSYKCPKCGRNGGGRLVRFSLEGNIAGTMGVFTCVCGNRDASIENAIQYATSEDWRAFDEECDKNMIMW